METNEKIMREALKGAEKKLEEASLEQMHARVRRIKEKLEEHGMDINAAFSYPKSSSYDYQSAVSTCKYAHSIVENDPEHPHFCMPNKPHYVIMRKDVGANFEKKAQEYAAQFITDFVNKMVAKIKEHYGNVTIASAHYAGTADPFVSSLLQITDTEGNQYKYNTICIINISKLGKLFNQWPTRKVK